jgi:hypothetical protein
MLDILFNGRVQVSSVQRSGFTFNVKLTQFFDAKGYFNASQAQIGDVLFIRGFNRKGYRLVIQAIAYQNAQTIDCTLVDESSTLTSTFPTFQVAALVRETPNRDYPMFPIGIPQVLHNIMLDWYAVLADRLNTCQDAITASQLLGDEIISLKMPNGSMRCITIFELRKYMHTWNTDTGGSYYFHNVTEAGQMNGASPPQY